MRADLMSFMVVRLLRVGNGGGANRSERIEFEVRKNESRVDGISAMSKIFLSRKPTRQRLGAMVHCVRGGCSWAEWGVGL